MEYTASIATAVERGLEMLIKERQEAAEWFEKYPDGEEVSGIAKRQLEEAKAALEWAKQFWLLQK